MTTPFTITLTNGATSFDVFPLETNGPGNLSVPRQVLQAILSGGPGVNYFQIANDLTYRFVPGFIFTIIDLEPTPPNASLAGIYTVGLSGSTFSGNVTTIPTVEALPRGAFLIVGVNVGAKRWSILGNHAIEFATGTKFTVLNNSNGASNTTYTVQTATNNGPNTDIIVTETVDAGAAADGLLAIGNYPVTGLTVGPGGSWTVAGDVTQRFSAGSTFTVTPPSVVVPTTFSVASATFSAGNTTITVPVLEIVPLTATTGGDVLIGTIPFGYVQYYVTAADDGISTPLSLLGRGTPNWGQALETNLVHMLEHFANDTPPPSPLTGQLWYDTASAAMFAYGSTRFDITSVNVGGGTWTVSGDATATLVAGSKFAVFGNTGIDVYNNENPGTYAPSLVFQVLTSIFGSGVTVITIDTLGPFVPPFDTVVQTSIPPQSTNDGSIIPMDDFHQVLILGQALTQDLDMGGNQIINLGDPVNPTDALNLQYADARYVNIAGDTMTGFLTLNADPTAALHAATKQYVDNAITFPANQIVFGTGTGISSNSALTYNATDFKFTVGSAVNPIDHSQSFASGNFTTNGDAQTGQYILKGITTDATLTEIFSSVSDRLVLLNNSTWRFEIMVVARRTDAVNDNAAFTLSGAIKRDANAASTAIVGTVSQTIDCRDDITWDVFADADTTNGSLRIQVLGAIGKTIRWVAFIRTVEVSQ